MAVQRCLLIADDLTGGADAGAQFAKKGLRTLLISLQDGVEIDLRRYRHIDVLAVNTDTRGLNPEKAFLKVSNLLKGFDRGLFPIIYKKIDSTLRGNIGYEVDAILKETNGSLCFLTPTYPEQKRTLVGGILIVGEKPLALTEMARSPLSPILESHVHKILQRQSHHKVGWIDLTHVASAMEALKKAVEDEQAKGSQIIIFDAVSRNDLRNIAEVGFAMDQRPLFVGSAGLAEEVARKLAPSETKGIPPNRTSKHLLIVSGTASSVTHRQLEEIERSFIPSFELDRSLIVGKDSEAEQGKEALSQKVARALREHSAILKTPSERLSSPEAATTPVHQSLMNVLASVVLAALKGSKIQPSDLVLVLTGGETAQHVINRLNTDGIEIAGELQEGIVEGYLIGGDWDGLTVVTKAGAFGKEDALLRTLEMLKALPHPTEKGARHEGAHQRPTHPRRNAHGPPCPKDRRP
ncbi:MAG: hypothetical protein N3G78_14670 [Desulfobacterota bacterium]|nr:hypothetical protein [Thermodesulfobacteriota bacterium]